MPAIPALVLINTDPEIGLENKKQCRSTHDEGSRHGICSIRQCQRIGNDGSHKTGYTPGSQWLVLTLAHLVGNSPSRQPTADLQTYTSNSKPRGCGFKRACHVRPTAFLFYKRGSRIRDEELGRAPAVR